MCQMGPLVGPFQEVRLQAGDELQPDTSALPESPSFHAHKVDVSAVIEFKCLQEL